MNKIFFVDFDGTITKTDTCDLMAKTFANELYWEINKLWETKKLTTEECANMLFNGFDADIDDLGRLMDTVEIDEYFKEFLDKCSKKGYEVHILSDGYDFNIDRIFKRENINVSYYANKLLFDSEKGFSIQCSYKNLACGSCGTCKTNLIQKLRKDNDFVIYIGDGYSDICAVKNADKVYAKGALYKFCEENEIRAMKLSSFMDVIIHELY